MHQTDSLSYSRRAFLTSAAGASLTPLLAAEPPRYRHRCYLGWITDLDPRGQPHVEWPSMRLDGELMAEYRATFTLLRKLGFDAIVIWGLYVARDWPVDLSKSVTPERASLIERLIDEAHAQGIRVYTGLGVYSWGFEEIIRRNPSLGRTNPQAMCASLPQSWDWMRRVTDYAMTRFPVDGVSMQSADQGRCDCDECKRYNDTQYHARINIRAAEYVRRQWPGKTIAVSGWGMKFDDPGSLGDIVELSRRLDYLIDVQDTSARSGVEHRKRLISNLACSFGTVGGPQVEPPQHWPRDRWFLPAARADGEFLSRLYADGGRACEYFFHIRANPGDEVSLWVAGKQLSDPETNWQVHLASTIEELYRTTRSSTVNALADLFVRAEDAYLRHLPTFRSGTIAMEPLISSESGPPVYIEKRLTAEGRAEYRKDLSGIGGEFRRLLPEVPDKSRLRRILRCIDNALADLEQAASRHARSSKP